MGKQNIKDNIQCLFKLNNELLTELVEDTLNIENWCIRDDELENRVDSIYYSERFQYLKELALKREMIFNDTEIVTWLDSLNILYYVFDNIKNEYLKDSIKIIQEYRIPYTNKRADYLLIYDNKILIIEFSFKKLGYDLQYETKLQQAIGYKELLSNILPKEIDIGTYTFLVEAEEDLYGNAMTLKNTDLLPNHYKIEHLAQFIEKFFNKNCDLAINALKQI